MAVKFSVKLSLSAMNLILFESSFGCTNQKPFFSDRSIGIILRYIFLVSAIKVFSAINHAYTLKFCKHIGHNFGNFSHF